MPQSFVPPNPISSVPGSTPPAGVDVVPPPWDLNARMWTFPFKLSESLSPATGVDINPNNTPDILQGLPAGSYPPGEKVHPSALSPIEGKPQQSGDNAAIIIVRYESTPAGPYDELIMSASFNNPETKQVTSRITNIYVSTANSVWNGRRNWNIAKYLARFEFEDTPEGSIMRVFHHERSPEPFSSSTKPFFTALIRESSPAARIPPEALGGSQSLVQPPLLAGRWPDGPLVEIGTDDPEHGRTNPWLGLSSEHKGDWIVSYIARVPAEKGGLEGFGDGIGFPMVKPAPVGAMFIGSIDFPASYILDGGEKATS